MRHGGAKTEKSIRFLTVRAILVVALVLAVLLGLKQSGVIVSERDVPVHIVEEANQAEQVSPPPSPYPS